MNQKPNDKFHKIDIPCNCVYCTMIDVMWGDPLLNDWEKKFVESVARQGGERNYSDKQKAKIKDVFKRMRKMRKLDVPKWERVLSPAS